MDVRMTLSNSASGELAHGKRGEVITDRECPQAPGRRKQTARLEVDNSI